MYTVWMCLRLDTQLAFKTGFIHTHFFSESYDIKELLSTCEQSTIRVAP